MIAFLVFWGLALTTVVAPFWGLPDLKKVGGEWAVITGAGGGIGRGYAFALAEKGIHVCLIGRTETKLKDAAVEIQTKYGVQSKVVVHDFSIVKDDDAANLRRLIGSEFDKVGILVNNVGVMGGDTNFIVPFISNTPDPIQYCRHMLNVNVQSMVLMTGLFLPLFTQKQHGVIVNLSSSCAIRPFKGHAVYSATKAFIDFFAESIRQECSDSNIIIQTVYPFFVRTALIPKVAHTFPSIIAPGPQSFARAAVGTIGLQERTSGCFQHNVQYHLVKFLDATAPKSTVDWIQNQLALYIKSMNETYVKKNP